MPTILHEQRECDVATMRPGPGLWLNAPDLARATGFHLKPEGLCKDAICVPVRGKTFIDDAGNVDAEAFWRFMGDPVVHDEARETFVLGTRAEARTQAMETLDAPDFSLPDVEGDVHALSDFRGKKVLLVTWASW